MPFYSTWHQTTPALIRGIVFDGQKKHYPESFPGVIMTFVGPYARVRKLSPDGTVVTLVTVWGWTETNIIGAAVGAAALVALSYWIRRKRRRRIK